MARMNSSLLMHFLKSSRFTGITGENTEIIFNQKCFLFLLGEEVFFDENGDGPGR
jgi:hypothetical protein